ncbi:MAG: LuxR C-terminal-related transcriptional regulator [Chloroflexi bacterium]|nr:LuxR C-terminal-related transcriptional regulator [Chloroflexota bacterium]
MDNNNGDLLRNTLTAREYDILTRLSTGLTDQEIAADLFLSPNTVRWYNRQIYSKLGVSNRTQAVAYAKNMDLLEDAPSTARPAYRHRLPMPSTPFIGRGREIAEVTQLMQTSRLLTLTGVGGTGKTRLALQVAEEIAGEFTDGACFVDLAPLSDEALVANAIARALDVIENPVEPVLITLKRVLAARELLLLLDNFEHVIQAAPLVSELLTAAPAVKVMVTSREPLRLAGEQEYPVPPLTLAAGEIVSTKSLLDSEAGALFVQRAQMVRPHFDITEASAQAIAQVCSRMDGLPLAIELAAVRCKLLTPQVLLERLNVTQDGSALDILAEGSRDAPPRHRTLRHSIEWSYNLLDNDEKTLFARLAVFRGGRSLEAIEAVCGEGLSIDVFDGLASLVDKSLVQQKETPDGEPRFVLLETIQEYAQERLTASSEAPAVQRRHAEYFVQLAEHVEPELRLSGFDDWCQRFELELDNLRTVLGWALDNNEVSYAVRLAGALCLFWYGKRPQVEGHYWTKQLLERLDDVPLAYHPKFLICAGHMAFLNDFDGAHHLFEQALTVSRELGDQVHTAWALIFLAYAMHLEPEVAMPLAEEGLALFRMLNHQPGIAQGLNIIGEISRVNGDDERAKQVYEECLLVCQQTGEVRRICYMCYNLAYIAQHAGEHEQAIEWGYRGLHLACDRDDKHEMANALAVLAGSFGPIGQPQRAARMLGASEAAAERMGAFHHPSDRPEVERVIAVVRGQLDDAAFQEAWQAGCEMSLEQAVAYVLEEAHQRSK